MMVLDMPEPTISVKESVLTDGSITLRPYVSQDAGEVYHAARESLAEMYPWMPWAHRDYTLKESRRFIKLAPRNWREGAAYEFGMFDAADGAYLGGCGLNRFDWPNLTANLGYWVRSSRTGRGVAPAATMLLAGWGFRKLGLRRIEIMVAAENSRSQRVAEKVGAQREATMRNRLFLYGKNHDAVLYSLVPADLAGRGA
jgi:ribosomal-protein-serine acetyltransferase